MKVKIMQRVVFHKYAEVEIEIPNLIDSESEVQHYLHNNEHLWRDKLARELSESEYEFGFGMQDCFTDRSEESEWRYEANGNGGHL